MWHIFFLRLPFSPPSLDVHFVYSSRHCAGAVDWSGSEVMTTTNKKLVINQLVSVQLSKRFQKEEPVLFVHYTDTSIRVWMWFLPQPSGTSPSQAPCNQRIFVNIIPPLHSSAWKVTITRLINHLSNFKSPFIKKKSKSKVFVILHGSGVGNISNHIYNWMANLRIVTWQLTVLFNTKHRVEFLWMNKTAIYFH